MSLEITGLVKVIGTTKQVSENYQTREMVVMTEEQYPQYITIQFSQTKCSLLDSLSLEQRVTVSINIKGKKYDKDSETKYFNTIEGWKIS